MKISQNPFVERKERISGYLSVASRVVTLNDAIKKKALLLENKGFDPIDSLHLAYAEYSGADFFLTCDDNIIRKSMKHKDIIKIEVCNPIEFILKEVFKDA